MYVMAIVVAWFLHEDRLGRKQFVCWDAIIIWGISRQQCMNWCQVLSHFVPNMLVLTPTIYKELDMCWNMLILPSWQSSSCHHQPDPIIFSSRRALGYPCFRMQQQHQ
jgi:hypothetical protein